MEAKGLRVNMGKTKVMRCQVGKVQQGNSGKWPCGVCGKGVGRNSIECTACKKWIHKKCSGIKGRLREGYGYNCPKCVDGVPSTGEMEEEAELTLGQDGKLECVEKFCYLGDMLGSRGGAEDASRTQGRMCMRKIQ